MALPGCSTMMSPGTNLCKAMPLPGKTTQSTWLVTDLLLLYTNLANASFRVLLFHFLSTQTWKRLTLFLDRNKHAGDRLPTGAMSTACVSHGSGHAVHAVEMLCSWKQCRPICNTGQPSSSLGQIHRLTPHSCMQGFNEHHIASVHGIQSSQD